MPITFDRDVPALAQNDGWSCAPTAARWAMTALGRHPTEQWFEQSIVADGVVSHDLGLLDATGAGLAAWLTKEYAEFGYVASNEPTITFEAVAAEIGPYPLLIGGRAWGHWSGVRGYDPANDLLLLANPADGWQGVQQAMNHGQWDALGPFSMVRIVHPDLIAPAPDLPPPALAPAPPPPPTPAFNVGPGILALMIRNGETPATDELHVGDPGRGWAVAMSTQGRTYTWIDSAGLCVVTEGWGA